MNLITLIRNNNCEIKYDVEYHKEWSDDELLSHIIFLDCEELEIIKENNKHQLEVNKHQLEIIKEIKI